MVGGQRRRLPLLLLLLLTLLLTLLLLETTLLSWSSPSDPDPPSAEEKEESPSPLGRLALLRKEWYELQGHKKAEAVVLQPYHCSGRCRDGAPTFHDITPSLLNSTSNMVYSASGDKNHVSMETFPTGWVVISTQHGGSNPAASAWSEVSGDVMLPEKAKWTRRWEWVPPPSGDIQPDLVVDGPHAFFHNWFPDNYGHMLLDHIPYISWLREHVSEDTRFLLLNDGLQRNFFEWFDNEFYKRITWLELGEVVHVKGPLYILNASIIKHTHAPLANSFHEWSESMTPPSSKLPRTHVVYYSRKGPRTYHGRVLEPKHETEVLRVIRDALIKHNRSEKLVIFNGHKDGRLMTFQEQFELFQGASVLIGPHGTGMCNSVWMQSGKTCAERPKLIEFACNSYKCQVQDGGPFRAHFFEYATTPWADYHQVNYDAALSTHWTTYINIRALRLALDSIWGVQSDDSVTISAQDARRYRRGQLNFSEVLERSRRFEEH